MKCNEFKKIEWKEGKKKREAELHSLECKECKLYLEEYEKIINVLRNQEEGLNIYQRIRPLLNKEKQEKESLGKKLIFKPNFINLRWALPAAAAILLVFIILFKSQFINIEKGKENANAKVNIITMVDTPEGIWLKWHDANKSEYIIIRSTDPKGIQNAVKIKVKGNSYLDKEASKYPMVFYKVL